MNVRRFNFSGNQQYQSLIQDTIANINSFGFAKGFNDEAINRFKNLLTIESKTEIVSNTKKIENSFFVDRFEFGKYINDILGGCRTEDIECDEYLWNWLSCFYIKEILSGKGLKNSRFVYRNGWHDLKLNLIRTPWLLYNINKENSYFALCNPLHVHSNMCEQYVSRVELVRNPKIAELCMKLYFIPEKKENKKNSDNHRKTKDGKTHPGVLTRLYKIILKLSKIYDLWDIDVKDLKQLVGKEFKIWDQELKVIENTKKNPNWTRNERIILLKYYFEEEDPIDLSTNKEKIKKISNILKSMKEHPLEKRNQSNFRSAEGVRRKILNFCFTDPRVKDEDSLEHGAKDDEKTFLEFYDKPNKILELNSIYSLLIKNE